MRNETDLKMPRLECFRNRFDRNTNHVFAIRKRVDGVENWPDRWNHHPQVNVLKPWRSLGHDLISRTNGHIDGIRRGQQFPNTGFVLLSARESMIVATTVHAAGLIRLMTTTEPPPRQSVKRSTAERKMPFQQRNPTENILYEINEDSVSN